MCEIVDNYAKEVAEEAVKVENKEMAKKLFEKGVDFDVVCQCIENITVEELKAIYKNIRTEE